MQRGGNHATGETPVRILSWGKFDKLAVTGTVVPSAKKVVPGKDRLMHGHGRGMPPKEGVPRGLG